MANSPSQYSIRIYRADGSYSIMQFPLMTTTAEVINTLSGANDAPPGKKITTSMRLYLRERGQGQSLRYALSELRGLTA